MEHVFYDPGMRAQYRVYGGVPLRRVREDPTPDGVGIDLAAARQAVRQQAGQTVQHFMVSERLGYSEAMARLKDTDPTLYRAYAAS